MSLLEGLSTTDSRGLPSFPELHGMARGEGGGRPPPIRLMGGTRERCRKPAKAHGEGAERTTSEHAISTIQANGRSRIIVMAARGHLSVEVQTRWAAEPPRVHSVPLAIAMAHPDPWGEGRRIPRRGRSGSLPRRDPGGDLFTEAGRVPRTGEEPPLSSRGAHRTERPRRPTVRPERSVRPAAEHCAPRWIARRPSPALSF